MKITFIYLLLALVTGALIPIQAVTNAAFNKSVANPLITGIMVFVVGFFGMLILSLAMRISWPSVNQLASAPGYGYLGGLIIATYVVMITVLVPRIGVGTSISVIVTGQILCAVAIDHFGFFGVHVRSIDANRLIGVLMMITGIYFIMKK
jgi:bacterial/archaeal transporter family-2 protein